MFMLGMFYKEGWHLLTAIETPYLIQRIRYGVSKITDALSHKLHLYRLAGTGIGERHRNLVHFNDLEA